MCTNKGFNIWFFFRTIFCFSLYCDFICFTRLMQSTISNKFSQYQQRQPASVVVSLNSLPHSHPKIYMCTTLTLRQSFEANIHHHKWRKALGQYESYIHITRATGWCNKGTHFYHYTDGHILLTSRIQPRFK